MIRNFFKTKEIIKVKNLPRFESFFDFKFLLEIIVVFKIKDIPNP